MHFCVVLSKFAACMPGIGDNICSSRLDCVWSGHFGGERKKRGGREDQSEKVPK